MTDQQLLKAGERLYKSFLSSQFTFLELAGLAAAREQRTPWERLGQHLKIAVFRLVVDSQTEDSTAPPPESEARLTAVTARDSASPETPDSPTPAHPVMMAAAAIPDAVVAPAPDASADSRAISAEQQTPPDPDPADSGEEGDIDSGGDV